MLPRESAPQPQSPVNEDDYDVLQQDDLPPSDDNDLVMLDNPMDDEDFSSEDEIDGVADAISIAGEEVTVFDALALEAAASKSVDESNPAGIDTRQILAKFSGEMEKMLQAVTQCYTAMPPVAFDVVTATKPKAFDVFKQDLSTQSLLDAADLLMNKELRRSHPFLIVRGFNTRHSSLVPKLVNDLFPERSEVVNPGSNGFRMKKKK